MNQVTNLKQDPADAIEAYNGLIDVIKKIDELEPKTKHLVFIGIKSLTGDIVSTNYHIQMAKKYGAIDEEIIGVILISSLNSKEYGDKVNFQFNNSDIKKSGKSKRKGPSRFNRRNFGRVTENKLFQIGINSIDMLEAIGSEQAFMQLLKVDSRQYCGILFKMECAIQNIRGDELSSKRKEELVKFYNRIMEMNQRLPHRNLPGK
jgi:DNA transformation protein and related proteins